MRKVVDTNYLRDPELREYLSASRQNKIVVTDYAELEMANADRVEDYLKSTAIAAKFPRQVILSKPIHPAGALRGKAKGMKKRMTDGPRTRVFRKWCPKRLKLLAGDPREEQRRLRRRDAARAQLHDIAEGGKAFVDDLLKHAEGRYTKDELAIIRDDKPLTPELQAKIKAGVDQFAEAFFKLSPHLREVPPKHEWPHTFIYRYAVAAYTHSLHWLAAGDAKDRKPEGFRNDFIDVAICTYATCFDGFLSKDKVANKIYEGARRFMKAEHGV